MTFFGMKDFSLKNLYSISNLDGDFKFEKGDIVVLFRATTVDPNKLVAPKGALKDLTVLSVKELDADGMISKALIPIGLEMIDLTRDMIQKGPESEDRTLLVDEVDLSYNKELSEHTKFPVFLLKTPSEVFTLRALDVLREEKEEQGEGN